MNSIKMPALTIQKTLYKKRMLPTFYAIVKTWVLIFITMTFFLKFIPLYFLPIYVLIMGTLQYHLNVLGHDGLHYSLSSSKKANDIICRFFLHGPQGAPLTMMRSSHLNHHRNLGKHADSDRQYYGLEQFKDSNAYKKWILLSFLGGMIFPILKKLGKANQKPETHTYRRSTKEAFFDYFSIIASQLILFFYILFLTGSVIAYFYTWILPLFTVMFGLNTLRSNLEHANQNCSENLSLFFTFRPSAIVRFFISPFNMNYHAEHHIAPAIPFYNLPQLLINKEPIYIITYDCYTSKFKQVVRSFEHRNSTNTLP